MATIRRLLKSVGLFCRISSVLQGSFAKETYHFKEPTNRSHPIAVFRAATSFGALYMLRHHVAVLGLNFLCVHVSVHAYMYMDIHVYLRISNCMSTCM